MSVDTAFAIMFCLVSIATWVQANLVERRIALVEERILRLEKARTP